MVIRMIDSKIMILVHAPERNNKIRLKTRTFVTNVEAKIITLFSVFLESFPRKWNLIDDNKSVLFNKENQKLVIIE